MADFDINNDQIGWIQYFLTNRWVELMIDGFIYFKYKVKTTIPQGSPISLIIFLIYISNVFLEIEKQLPDITCLSLIDNLGFLVADKSMLKIKKLLKKVRKITLD